MIVYTMEKKTLEIPKGIGNVNVIDEGHIGGGISREEVQEMIDEAVIEAGTVTVDIVDEKISAGSVKDRKYAYEKVEGLRKDVENEYAKKTEVADAVEEAKEELEAKIPDVSDFATRNYVDEKIIEAGSVTSDIVEGMIDEALVGYATEEQVNEVESKIPSLEGYATEEYVDSKVSEVENKIPSIEGLATETVVDEKIDNALTGYATEEYVQKQIIESGSVTSDIVDEMIDDALIDYYTQTETDAEIEEKIEANNVEVYDAINGRPTFQEVNEKLEEVEGKIPSVEGLASETYVNDALTGYYTKTETDWKIDEDVNAKISENNNNYFTKEEVEAKEQNLINKIDNQQFKTINGESIKGEGNIEIHGAEGDYLPLSGGTMSGHIGLGDGTNENGVYVDGFRKVGTIVHHVALGPYQNGAFFAKHLYDGTEDSYMLLDGTGMKVRYSGENGKYVTTDKIRNVVDSKTVQTIWTGTQTEYNAITNKNSNTLYIIK